MSPATIVGRLLIALALVILGVIVAALQYWVWHDHAAALACLAGGLMCAGIAAPEPDDVARLILALRTLARDRTC